jgi:hypothetical protein
VSWLPDDWEAHRASGWWELCHLEHTKCGFVTTNTYDLVLDQAMFGRREAQTVVWSHKCEGES